MSPFDDRLRFEQTQNRLEKFGVLRFPIEVDSLGQNCRGERPTGRYRSNGTNPSERVQALRGPTLHSSKTYRIQ